jgi:hypothetical protein
MYIYTPPLKQQSIKFSKYTGRTFSRVTWILISISKHMLLLINLSFRRKWPQQPIQMSPLISSSTTAELSFLSVKKATHCHFRNPEPINPRGDQPDLRHRGCCHWLRWTATPIRPPFSAVEIFNQSRSHIVCCLGAQFSTWNRQSSEQFSIRSSRPT